MLWLAVHHSARDHLIVTRRVVEVFFPGRFLPLIPVSPRPVVPKCPSSILTFWLRDGIDLHRLFTRTPLSDMSALRGLRTLQCGIASSSRAFSTTAPTFSHIGSMPVSIPDKVTVTYPTLSIPPSTPRHVAEAQRFVEVKGPLGTLVVPIDPSIILQPADKGQLTLDVHDAKVKKQRSMWGLTRALVKNAVTGVSEGYTTELRLVGVGYRATIEPIPEVFRELLASVPRVARPAKPGAPPYHLPPIPTERLNLKLGYSHPVLVNIPEGIKVSVPQPTKIVLTGTDNQKLGLFAAKIRRWRKPEPYRGKVRSLKAQTRGLRMKLTTSAGYFHQ